MVTSIFEVGMLLCFAAAWPFNIYRSYKCRTAIGKSITFEAVVEVGYIFGMINNWLHGTDYVMAFYILDFALVGADMLLWARNRRLDRQRPPYKDVPLQED